MVREKPTLLAQFTKTYPEHSFSFFVKPDQYISTPKRFLQELCKQMYVALHGAEREFAVDTAELKQQFSDLYYKVAKLARTRNENFYFVVDGLEWLSEDIEGENFLRALPTYPYQNMYLLASSRPGQIFAFDFDSETCPHITELEISKYFELANLTLEQITLNQIFKVCNRMPGYLDQLRREMLDSPDNIDEITKHLPIGYSELLNRHWSQLAITDPVILNSLAILAFSQTPVTKPTLAEMLTVREIDLERKLRKVSWINYKDERIFIYDAHRQFVADKLANQRAWAEETLINHYSKNPYSLESIERLPVLLKESRKFSALQKLINIDYLNRTLQDQHDLSLLRRSTQLVAEAAYEERNWQISSRYTMMNSILTTLSTMAVLESEVDALLALKDYEQSYILASQATLQADRLQLIAKIGSKIVETGETVPGTILAELEQLSSQVDPTEISVDRLSEIVGELFYVLPKAASELVDRFVGPNVQDKSFDILLVLLTANLEQDAPEYVEDLRTRISDRRLLDLAKTHSPVVASLSAGNVLARTENIEDVSAKLFQLRSWCNTNRDNSEAIVVVRKALELITAADPNPSMRHLRQFAEPLLKCNDDEIVNLIERFDLLKDTALSHPIDEKIRLELVLAAIEANVTSDGRASSRFYKVFYYLDEQVQEVDSRCYGLVRMLVSLPEIIPDDNKMRIELEEYLRIEFEQLLNVSASHYSLTKRIMGPLANHDVKMAVAFAEKLNLEERRNSARKLIAGVYSDRDWDKIDFPFLSNLIKSITDPGRRSWTFVHVLNRLADSIPDGKIPAKTRDPLRQMLNDIEEFTDPISSSLAFAHAFNIHKNIDVKAANQYFDKLRISWKSVDAIWDRLNLGFELATLIAKNDQERARELIDATRQLRINSPLAESVIAEICVNILFLANRAVPGIVKGTKDDVRSLRQRSTKGIEQVPSVVVQCKLFSDLALRLQLAGKPDDFTNVVNERVFPLLNSLENSKLRSRLIVGISPCLYEHERSVLFEELDGLSPKQRDKAIISVLQYILMERPPSDPINPNSLRPVEDYYQALQYCVVLEKICTDSAFYTYLDKLIDALIQKHTGKGSNNERCRLSEKNALVIAKKLRAYIDAKLPDQNNIKHDGYKIAAYACLARLRASLRKDFVRAQERWEEVTPTWDEIAGRARKDVPNLADKALVLTWVGQHMYRSDMNLAYQLLEEAYETIHKIPNIVDRSQRLQTLAGAWSELDDESSAKLMLQEAMSILEAWSWDGTRDHATGSILEAAHRIDPEFAASLSSTIDNPLIRHKHSENVLVKDLKKEPEAISKREQELGDSSDKARMYSKLAWELLESLCTDRGRIQSDDLVLNMTKGMLGAEFKEFNEVAAWSVENQLRRTDKLTISTLSDSFDGFFESLELTGILGEVLVGQGQYVHRDRFGITSAPVGLQLFSVGTREEALTALRNWIQQNTKEYLKIYDPYFTHEQLDILKYIPPDVRVIVLTSWKAQKGLRIGDEDAVLKRYNKTWWEEISDQSPPPARIHVFGTASTGVSPLHERYFISSNGRGIRLGTSESGLGKKDSDIREMTIDETEKIEKDFVDRMIVTPPINYEDERLISSVFNLG